MAHAATIKGWRPGMVDERDLAAGAAELEQLADQFDGQTYAVALVTGGGRGPGLPITNRRAGQLPGDVYSDGGSFWSGWAGRVGPGAALARGPAPGDPA